MLTVSKCEHFKWSQQCKELQKIVLIATLIVNEYIILMCANLHRNTYDDITDLVYRVAYSFLCAFHAG